VVFASFQAFNKSFLNFRSLLTTNLAFFFFDFHSLLIYDFAKVLLEPALNSGHVHFYFSKAIQMLIFLVFSLTATLLPPL